MKHRRWCSRPKVFTTSLRVDLPRINPSGSDSLKAESSYCSETVMLLIEPLLSDVTVIYASPRVHALDASAFLDDHVVAAHLLQCVYDGQKPGGSGGSPGLCRPSRAPRFHRPVGYEPS